MVVGLDLLLIPLILNSALLAGKKESTTIQPFTETTTIVPDTVVEEHLSQDWLEVDRGLNNTALQDWLEVHKGLNNTAMQLDFKRAWVAKAIRQLKNEAKKKLNPSNRS